MRLILLNAHRHKPSQLLTPSGVLARLKRMAVERNLFVLGGLAGMGGVCLLALSAVHFDVEANLTTFHLILLGGCVLMVSVLTREGTTGRKHST